MKMKVLKVIGQILAAIVYTCIFTGLLYMVLVLPLVWVLTLKPFWIVVVIILLGGILQGIIIMAHTFLLMPYMWIVKENVVALIISIALILFNLGRSDVLIWQASTGHGLWMIIFAIIATGLILEAVFATIPFLVNAYAGEK